jgi:hypothetical protein
MRIHGRLDALGLTNMIQVTCAFLSHCQQPSASRRQNAKDSTSTQTAEQAQQIQPIIPIRIRSLPEGEKIGKNSRLSFVLSTSSWNFETDFKEN